jgi:ABC-2 type transport system ATP-binding protein
MSNAIEIQNLCKHYPDFDLENVSFHIPQGICCGFVGPNGAGKTTTLKSMVGMTVKNGGSISLLGRPDGDWTVKEDIGVLFDQPYYQEDWTAMDVEKGLRLFYRNWNSRQYHSYLSRFGLKPTTKFKNYSRGMKMKLGLAANLSHDAKLLLLDEPTGGLDPVSRDEILDILRDYMVADNKTILFSTHITSDLDRIADMIVYISHGKVSYCGSKDEWIEKYCIVRGNSLPSAKRKYAIGLRENRIGYECLMELPYIGGLSSDTLTEQATIDDVIVYMERNSRNVENDETRLA